MQDKIRIDLLTGLRIETVSPFESGPDIIDTPCLISFIQPKWLDGKWVEGGVKPISTPIEPSMEDRLASVENTQSQVINVLAEITGVTL